MVMTAGTLQGVSGSTDLIKVEVVTAVLGQGVGLGQGSVSGRARVAHTGMDIGNFNPGEILVAQSTSADFLEGDSQGRWDCYGRGESDKSCCCDWLAVGSAGNCGSKECN